MENNEGNIKGISWGCHTKIRIFLVRTKVSTLFFGKMSEVRDYVIYYVVSQRVILQLFL